MRTTSQAFSVLLPLIYLIVVFFYGQIFVGRLKKLASYSVLVLIILLAVHAAEIALRGAAIGTIPLATKFDALSFLAFAITIVYLIIELSVDSKATGFFALALSFIIQTIASVLYNWDLTHNPLLSNPIYAVHVVLTILGYTAVSISALYALLYVMLNHNLRNHNLGLVYEKLPPLSLLEQMSIRSVQIGIIFLGLGLLLGHLRALDILGTFMPADYKVIFTDLIWVAYVLAYLISQLRKWRGRWMAYLSMSGFGILIFANIMILFIENSFHQFQ